MQQKQKVFITGASSHLLQQVVALLSVEEYEIIGLTRSEEQQQHHHKIRWCTADLHDQEKYAHELTDSDIIIHGAALTHSQNARDYFRVNVEGTRMLLNSIPPSSNPLVIFISSRVAGPASGAYGRSKLQAEELVQNGVRRWIILRPSEVFGGTKNEGIDSTIASALDGGIKPCPVGIPSRMYPLHVKDAARAIHQLGFINPTENTVRYVNGAVGYNYKELLKTIEGVTGNTIYPLPIPKMVLEAVAVLASLFKIEVGIVPDQVKRLYSEKKHDSDITYQTISLDTYIKGLATN